MHAKFNLAPQDKEWREYISVGQTIHNQNIAQVEDDLSKFKNADGNLLAEEIIDNWFPSIKADVFLSHSHKDENLVIGFAGWLHKKFGLNAFVDSTIWCYSDRLLKAIDKVYCKGSSDSTYDYNLRNRSTSHVHMMLSTALMDMIDRCECIIFINTPSSFKPTDYLKDEGRTESPWIYSEIAMTRMLRQKSPDEHRDLMIKSKIAIEGFREVPELRVDYPIDTLHLTPMSLSDLEKWENSFTRGNALDILYKMKAKHRD